MTFEADIRKFAEKTGGSMRQVVAAVGFQISEAIIMATPVDKGRARGNWIAAVDEPVTDADMPSDKVGAVALLRAKKQAEEAVGKVFYLTNSLPYIRRLEYGWSQQAPEGMVRVAVQGFQKAVNDATR